MKSILFVDDNDGMRKTFVRMLETHYSISAVSSVPEALVYLDNIRVDMVITDFRLGDLDGVDLLRLVRARWPQCAVVLLSGLRQSQTLGVTFDEVFLKPIEDCDFFVAALDAILAKREQNEIH